MNLVRVSGALYTKLRRDARHFRQPVNIVASVTVHPDGSVQIEPITARE